MSLINDDETNSITKLEILQDFFEEDIEQCEFRTHQYVKIRSRFDFI
jgi:hypothetical protein